MEKASCHYKIWNGFQMNKNIFYAYAYLDPRKPGIFDYGEVVFNFEPFYIGKGHSNRIDDHLKEVLNNHQIQWKGNQLKYNKIRSILKNDKPPILIQIRCFENETNALEFETNLIKKIGRLNLNMGPLTNLTDGGDGLSGYKHTNESKKKMSISKQNMTQHTKNKISLKLKGIPIGFRGTDSTRLLISENTKLQIGEKNSVFKTLWINNGIKNKRVKDVSFFLNSGWFIGRIKWKIKEEI